MAPPTKAWVKRALAAPLKTETLLKYVSAADQIDRFYDRWHKNLDVVAKAANLAYFNVQEIISIKDPSKISMGWVMFDLLLQVALPGVYQVSKHYANLTRKVAEYISKARAGNKAAGGDVDEILEDLKQDVRFITELVHRGVTRITDRADGYEKQQDTQSNAVTTQLQSLTAITEQIVRTQGRLQVAKENRKAALRRLLETAGNKIFHEDANIVSELGEPPALINDRFGDIIYALEWRIMAKFVREHMRLKIHVDAYEKVDVFGYYPSPLTRTACETIFQHFNKELKLQFLVTDPEAPQARGVLHAVTSWEHFASVWVCDVKLVYLDNRYGVPTYDIKTKKLVKPYHTPPLGKLHPMLAQRAIQTTQAGVW